MFIASDIKEKSLSEKNKIAVKLHRLFGHPIDSKKLKDLLQDAKIYDE